MISSAAILLLAAVCGLVAVSLLVFEVSREIRSGRVRKVASKRFQDERRSVLLSDVPHVSADDDIDALKHDHVSATLGAFEMRRDHVPRSLRSLLDLLSAASKSKHQAELIRDQLPAAFELMASGVASGLSLLQAIDYAAQEAAQPLRKELATVVTDVAAGMSLNESLERFRKRFPLHEIDSLLIMLELQHRTGGNVRSLLVRAAQTQREAAELRRALRVKTAQARFSSRMVGLLPLGLLGVLSLFSADYLRAFFSSPGGIVLFLIACAMETAGYVLVKKLAEVSV